MADRESMEDRARRVYDGLLAVQGMAHLLGCNDHTGESDLAQAGFVLRALVDPLVNDADELMCGHVRLRLAVV